MEVTLDYIARRNANKFPEKAAVIYEDRRISYKELDERADRLSNAMMSLGMKKCDRVGVLMYNGPEFFDCIFGIPRAGGIFIPMNYRFRANELEYVLNKAKAEFLIYEEEFSETVDHLRRNCGIKSFVCIGGDRDHRYEELICGSAASKPSFEPAGSDTAMILFTSGTTGNPKGVCLTQGGQVWSSVNLNHTLSWRTDDTALIPTPLFHTAALNRSLGLMYAGATLVILRHFRPERFMELIETEKITVTGLVPTMFAMIRQMPDAGRYDVSSVKEITIGAATVPTAVLKQVCDFFSKARVWNGYGLTECPSATTMRVDGFPHRMNSIGKPYINLEVRIMDETGCDLPAGEIGEICLRGPMVMKGYFNDDAATRQTFFGDWLRTGDLGKLDDDGFLYIADRKKDMIISGGENIYPKEIEDVLYTHEGVLEAAVIGVEDELWGESVKAIIQPMPGANPTQDEIIAFCAERLAGYKKPKSVVFVKDMPKTATNKILKRRLREIYGKEAT